MAHVDALLLDFNGTLSDDERVLAALYSELFADHGQLLPPSEYLERFAGMSDAEIFRLGLGERADVAALTEERVERYRAKTADGSTISADARRAVAAAAARVPVVVVTSAFRREVEPALAGSGLAGVVAGIVAVEDVANPKPAPDPYLAGLPRSRASSRRARSRSRTRRPGSARRRPPASAAPRSPGRCRAAASRARTRSWTRSTRPERSLLG